MNVRQDPEDTVSAAELAELRRGHLDRWMRSPGRGVIMVEWDALDLLRQVRSPKHGAVRRRAIERAIWRYDRPTLPDRKRMPLVGVAGQRTGISWEWVHPDRTSIFRSKTRYPSAYPVHALADRLDASAPTPKPPRASQGTGEPLKRERQALASEAARFGLEIPPPGELFACPWCGTDATLNTGAPRGALFAPAALVAHYSDAHSTASKPSAQDAARGVLRHWKRIQAERNPTAYRFYREGEDTPRTVELFPEDSDAQAFCKTLATVEGVPVRAYREGSDRVVSRCVPGRKVEVWHKVGPYSDTSENTSEAEKDSTTLDTAEQTG